MSRRSRIALAIVLTTAVVGAVASAAPPAAGPRDVLTKMRMEAARKQYADGKAEAAATKLEEALAACLPAWCSLPVRAAVLRDLGIVRAGGQRRQDDAVKLFVEALALDPKLTLPPMLATKDVQAAFDAAQAAASKPPASAAAASATSAAPATPPPPPPEPRPISSIGTAKWVPGVGFTEEATGVEPPVRAQPPTAVALEKPPALWTTRNSLYLGWAQAQLAPSVKGFQPCDPADAQGLHLAYDIDFHTPGTSVGHRLFLDSATTFGKALERPCGGLQKVGFQSHSFGYGFDLHPPLPGVLSGLSIGVLAMVRFDLLSTEEPNRDPTTLTYSPTDKPSQLDVGGRWGAHVRWRFGRPETGFHATLDLSRMSRWSPHNRGDYLRYQVDGGYQWIGVYLVHEARFHSAGGDPDVSSFAQLYARNTPLKSLTSAGVVFTF